MWLGEYPEDFTTVVCMFTTHDSTGAPVAPLSTFEAADVRIYKNGVNTEKTSTNGVTMTSPFDTVTGLHCVTLDTSNDTGDSGFWTTGGGSIYTIVLVPDTETVGGIAVTKVIGQFRLKLTADTAPTAAVNAAAVWDLDATAHQTQGTFGQAIGDPAADTNTIYKAVVTDATGATVGVDVVAVQADTDDIQTRIPAALTSDGNIKADALKVGGSDPASTADTADAVWDEATAGHVIAATFGVKAGALAFTVAGQVDANIQSVNDVTVTGTGVAGDTWGP